MKARPRHAENRIAQELNKIFLPLGYDAFIRIPVTGRRGPDLCVNDTQLVVDVKTRKEVPKLYFGFSPKEVVFYPDHCSLSIQDLPVLGEQYKTRENFRQSKMVSDYLSHMHEWTVDNMPDGISAVVVHSPGMPYGKARFIFYRSDIGKMTNLFSKGVNK